MAVQILGALSGVAAVAAAYFWARSAAIKVPRARSTAEAKASGTGISMGNMNDAAVELVEALQRQATHSKWGAGSAAVAAALQVAASLAPTLPS